jgi:hypothetical protein
MTVESQQSMLKKMLLELGQDPHSEEKLVTIFKKRFTAVI